MNIGQRFTVAAIGACLIMTAGAANLTASAADISGAGATFPYPIYAKWADAYKKLTGIGLNYQSIGSGGGIKQIKAKTVTFGASDMPLKPEDLKASGSAAISDDHRRRGAGGQHQGYRAPVNCTSTARPSQPSTWAISASGTIRGSRS